MQKNKTAHHIVKQGASAFDYDSDEEGATAIMAVKGARPKPVAKAEQPPAGWIFPSGQATLAGDGRKFAYGILKGKTFIDVTLEHPEQYFTNCRSKTFSNED